MVIKNRGVILVLAYARSDLLNELFGKNRLFAWAYRIYGFIVAVRHIRAHTQRVSAYLLSVDRAGMTEDELAASVERQRAVEAATSKRAKEHLKAIFSINYDPAKRPAPRGVQELLDQMSTEMAIAA